MRGNDRAEQTLSSASCLCAVLDGELPIGGPSSSAAVIITFLSALSKMNGIKLTANELIPISKEAENQYVGVACEKLDPSCEGGPLPQKSSALHGHSG